MTTSPQDRAAEAFAAELARWRIERGLSKKQLASEMGFDPSYVSHVEGRRHRPTEDFARRAEAVLQADGEIWLRYTEYEELRRTGRPGQTGPVVSEQWLPPGTGLVVEQETATLSYVDSMYHCTIQRALYNAGPEPVIRYPVRIAVDRYPSEPERSNRFYREHPLTWEELNLTAIFGTAPGERMRLRPIYDRDSFKEIWLLFENDQGRFPLYRGQRSTISYTYQVGEDKWGQWFQRAVRLPTRRLSVHLDFPAALEPMVWGVQTSLTAESALRTPVERTSAGERVVFVWSTDHPPMHTRFRLEWRFKSPVPHQRQPDSAVAARASDRMLAAGIVQRGDDRLRQPARPLNLPTDEARAHDVVALLRAALDRVGELHSFGKGVGLAAPQLGLAWAAAVIRPPEDKGEVMVLLNPRVVGSSGETDEQYEGCLSFFDVRGLVRRPLRLLVEHESYGGSRIITAFEQAMARLVGHEIDHLEGKLYTDRMTPGTTLVPVEEYRESGAPWRY
ncbi:MAG: formylmethionine deformylase [Actinobacteria bacterium 13_1_20CM_3_71_11]|nr:MAG: formylmethionine deformylase [Actinobacteria bacterium 13_1_20CM_3_71_11]